MAGIASTSSSSSEDLTTQEAPAPRTVEPMDALLQRRRDELLNELKRIEHGEKPVTGKESRNKVDHLLTRRQRQIHNNAPVANEDDVEEHRPEQVTVEVQGLLQRRSVSSLLSGSGFRRSLERVFRSHLGPAPRTRAAESPLARVSESASSRTPSPQVSSSTESPAPVASNINTTVRITPQSNSQTDSNTTTSASIPTPPPVAPLLDVHQDPNFSPEERMRRWNQDDFVMEISELVHRQLVSSTLNGRFRDRLENMVMTRVSEAGHDGSAVQEAIQNLPRSNIRHNDFSHLGIPTMEQMDFDDAVSVISATASASIPYAQSNRAVQREMSTMRSQISQLTNMLKKSLELQVDIQRSIKQEVAAAMSQHNSQQQTATAAVAAGGVSKRANDTKCIICLDGDSDAVLYRCGHLCLCFSCAMKMKSEHGHCPACRAPIVDVVRAYRISSD